MNAAGQTICLTMIVKDEAPVIRRCLDSVRPLIDHWVIVDTGSSDGTQDIIRGHLKDVPGSLHERPWRDFAHNRSEALSLARPHGDYSLIIDADDALEIPAGFQIPELGADSFIVDIQDGGIRYQRPQLVRNTLPWRYQGVLHEFLTCEEAGPPGHLPVLMHRNHDGARRRDPQTYRKDAAILEAALGCETDAFLISRYTFYLAEAYRDCGEKEKALQHYLERGELGFWQEEVFVSLYAAGQIKEQLGHPEQEVIDAYLRAADALPARAEALHGASRFCRYKGRNEEGYQLARRGLDIPLRTDALFVEPWIYEYGLLDELAVNGYWSGHYRECLDASLKILATGKLSGGDMQRVVANARLASERLPGEARAPNLGSLGAEGFIEQHALVPPRPLRSRLAAAPRVLVAILAKQKEPSLPLYLDCIEALDYPKSSIVLYIRTNNNTDRTEQILRDWVARVGHLYAAVEFDGEDVAARVEQFGVHEWNATRFRVLGHIRNVSLRRTLEQGCDFYFVSDVDNFVRPCTLRELVALDLPIVAPFLRSIKPDALYSNLHAEIDENGYFKNCDQYYWILNRYVRGIIEMPLVHTTYLIRADVLSELTYDDATGRFEYVIFSHSARAAAIPQYFDNRQIYGYITFDKGGIGFVEDGIERARSLLAADMNRATDPTQANAARVLLKMAGPDVAATTACRSSSNAGGDATAPSQPPVSPSLLESLTERFTATYAANEWRYGSGHGSLPINNVPYIEFISNFIVRNDIRTVVDLGCGDWQFSRFMDWSKVKYAGFDLVEAVINENNNNFSSENVEFKLLRDLSSIPSADLLICKDVMQHLPNRIVIDYIEFAFRKFRYILITNDDLPEQWLNGDIRAGNFRPVRLDRHPFNYPAATVFGWNLFWTDGGKVAPRKIVQLIAGAPSMNRA